MKAQALMSSILLVGASTLLTAAPAFAALDCTGSYFGFDFHLSGATSGAHVSGPVAIAVSQDGQLMRGSNLQVTSSAISATTLNVQATDGAGATLVLNATYQNGVYVGPMDVGNTEGHATPTMTCKVN